MEEIQRKRFVKVAIVSDSDEYNAGRAKTVTKALETMDKRYGIKLGGYSFMKVSPAGAWTLRIPGHFGHPFRAIPDTYSI
jgi:hypothetical protein